MTIKVNDSFPAVTLKHLTENGMQELDVGAFLKGKKVVLFAVPGAFTPTCSARHLPGYVERAKDFAAKGVDAICCMAVNDPFVMKAWAQAGNAAEAITMLPDGNGELTGKLGLELDARANGLGIRSKRFAMLIEDGVVKDVQVEAPGAFEVSSADFMLGRV